MENDRFFRSIVEHSPDIISRYDRDLNCLYVNPAFERITGIKAKAVIGKRLEGHVLSGDLIRQREVEFRKVFEGGEMVDYDFVFQTPCGERSYHSRLIPEMGPDGDVQTLLVITRDVTERVALQRDLKRYREDVERLAIERSKDASESEQRFRDIAENAREWIWETDADGLYTYVSPVIEDILGFSPEDVVGKKHFYDFFHPDDREELKAQALAVFAQKEPFRDFPNRNIRKDGSEVWIETSGIPVLDERGGLRGYRGADTDITDRRRADEKVRESESFLQSVFDGIQDGISILDSELNVVRTNVWIERMYQEEMPLVGCKCYSVYQRREEPCAWCPALKSFKSGNVESAIVPYPSEADPKGWIDLTSFPLRDSSGNVTGMIEHVKDVTDRVRAENELKSWKNRYETAIKATGHVLYDWSPATNEVTYAGDIEGLLGYTVEEMVGGLPRWESLVHPDDRPGFERSIRKMIEAGEHELLEYRIGRKDGSHIYVEDRGRFILDENGRPTRMLGFVIDVTERKRAEMEQHKLASVVRYSGELMNLATPDGRMVFLNDAGCRLLGISRDEVPDTGILDVIPDHLKEKVAKEVVPAILAGDGWSGDLQYLNLKTGRTTDVQATTFLIRDPATREPAYLANVSVDITYRKRAEEALRRERQELSLILNSSPNIIFYKDDEGRFIRVNKAFAQALKMTEEEFVGKTVFDLYSREIAQRMMEDDREVIRTGQPKLNIIESYESAGGVRWVRTDKIPTFGPDGRTVGLVGVAQDITERREIELMKEKLMRDVTHSLKTPVAMMEMAMEMQRSGIRTDDIDKLKKAERIMSDNIRLMRGDLDKVVQMNVIDMMKGRRKAAGRKSSLKSAAAQALKNIGPLAERKGLTVSADISRGAERVAAGKDDLRVLVGAIFENAVKFTDEGRISIKGRVRGRRVELCIRDTGKGMTGDEVKRATERFYQGYPATDGAGLGLAICKEIVDAYGGSIELKSKGRGKGTTVSIVLPR